VIYTTYYNNLGNMNQEGLQLGISRGVPDWFTGITAEFLAPPWELVKALKNNEITADTFAMIYETAILGNLNAEEVGSYLQEKILVCHEVPTDFCHRHLVSRWLNKNNFLCMEL